MRYLVTMTGSIGLVIPAYDPDVPRLISYLETVQSVVQPDEIRIEFDAPESHTVVEGLSRVGVTVNAVEERRGKGAAITHGFDQLDTDILAFTDADGSTPATSLAEVIHGLGRSDVCVGSRRHPEADVTRNQSIVRKSLGDVFARGARLLLGVPLHDFQCGAKAMTREVWQRISDHIYEPGFAWDLEVVGMAHVHGFEIVEIPILWEDQPGSTVDPVATAVELGTALFVVHHRMKVLSGSPTHQLISRVEKRVVET